MMLWWQKLAPEEEPKHLEATATQGTHFGSIHVRHSSACSLLSLHAYPTELIKLIKVSHVLLLCHYPMSICKCFIFFSFQLFYLVY